MGSAEGPSPLCKESEGVPQIYDFFPLPGQEGAQVR